MRRYTTIPSAAIFGCLLCWVPCVGGPLQLNPLALDPSLFRITDYAAVPGALSMLGLGGDNVGVASYAAGILAFGDANHDGIADGAGAAIYSAPGAHTGLVQAGNFYLDGNSGPIFTSSSGQAITVLQPGAVPTALLTAVGALQFSFPSDWEHSQMGIAARPVTGQPGSFDVVFNIGSQFDHELSTGQVQLSGLAAATLDGDSLYAITLNLSGTQPTASGLRKVATGIRNVIAMGFQPGTGDFYFADNAIDGPDPLGEEPPQAEEINRIAAADLGVGAPLDFGYPNCYIQYRTGAQVGSGCVPPLFAIQPLPNGTLLGSESEGVTQLAFAPAAFPAGFNNGIFLGFAGKNFRTGSANEENAVGYYDFTTGHYVHFTENSQEGVSMPIGIMTTANALFIADFGAGNVYEVTAATAPEPGTAALISIALAVCVVTKSRSRRIS